MCEIISFRIILLCIETLVDYSGWPKVCHNNGGCMALEPDVTNI